RHVEAQLLAGLAERVQREQPVLAVEHAEDAVLFGNLQQTDVVVAADRREGEALLDRKSTRLNSSHVSISYAVFCLKKKNYPQAFARLRHSTDLTTRVSLLSVRHR